MMQVSASEYCSREITALARELLIADILLPIISNRTVVVRAVVSRSQHVSREYHQCRGNRERSRSESERNPATTFNDLSTRLM